MAQPGQRQALEALNARGHASDEHGSIGSLASRWSVGSTASILSIGSTGSILSIGSTGSILSIGSIGSALSIGSAGSLLSVLSVGSILSVFGFFDFAKVNFPPQRRWSELKDQMARKLAA